MKKFIKLCFGTLAIISCCCGCGKTQQETVSVPAEFPKEINIEEADHIKVQAQCVYPDSYKNGNGKKAALGDGFFWDRKEEILQLFFENKPIEETYHNEFDIMEEYIYFTDNMQTMLSIDTNNTLSYSTAGSIDITNVIYIGEQFSDYNGDRYLQNDSLAFMEKEQAWAEVSDFLEKLGVGVPGNITCYVMEHSIMQEEEERLALEAEEYGGKITKKEEGWTQADDCYYFVGCTLWEGCPVLPEMSGEGFDENNLKVMYGQEGIIGVQINGYYPLQEDGDISIQSPEKVVTQVSEILGNVISDDSYEIQEVTLCQKIMGYHYKTNTGDVIPVWECKVLVKSWQADDPGYVQKLYYNAETLDGME